MDPNPYPKVRKVKLKDRKKLTALLKAFVNKSGNSTLANLVPQFKAVANKASDTKAVESTEAAHEEVISPSDDMYGLIKSVVESLFNWVEDDLAEWFMDLTNIKSLEDWENQEFDIEVYIVEQLLAQKGFKHFFLKALDAFKAIQG